MNFNEKLTNLLNEEVERELLELKTLSSGSKEQATAVDSVMKLYHLTIEQAKADADIEQTHADITLANDKEAHDFEIKRQQNELNRTKETHDFDIRNKQNALEERKIAFEERSGGKSFNIQKKDTIIKWCIGIAEIVLPLTFYAIWLRRGFKFEETGTYTSSTFRNLFNNFKPVKR
ncbi:MAG: hypothetical protein LUD27_02360 [Clostridia bacterium]|nr:hypothetical protein [Clostridia bacterium]